MDSINFEDGGTVWAVGCANGKIFLRFLFNIHVIMVLFEIKKEWIGKNILKLMTVENK